MADIRKTAACILSMFLCAFSLTSCTSRIIITDDDSKTEENSSTFSIAEYQKEDLTDEKITLVVWESADGPSKWIQQAGEKFTEIYPNIEIEVQEADIANTFYMLRTGEYDLSQPDLFGAPHDRLAQMVESDIILPTRDYETVTTNTLSSAYSSLFLGDTMYGYPTSCETYALFYNKKLLSAEDIPDTWDKMLSFSENFPKLFPDKYGFLFQCNAIYYLSMFMTEDNNQLIQSEEVTGLMTNAAVSGAGLAKKFFPLLPENAIKMTLTEYEDMFVNGEAAIIVDGPWFISKAEKSGMDFGIAKLPAFTEGGSPALSLSGVRGMFVYNKTKHPLEAAAFAKFLTTKEMQELRLKITGALPASNISVDSDITSSFIDQLEYSYSLPNNSLMKNFWGYSQQFCEELYNGEDVNVALAKYDQYIKTGNTDGYIAIPWVANETDPEGTAIPDENTNSDSGEESSAE